MNENQHNAVRLAAILEKDDAPIPPNTNGKAHGHPDLCTFCNSRPRSHGDMCDVCWTYQQTGVKPKSKPAATAPPTVTAVTSREEGSSYPCVHCKQRRKVNSLYCTECQIEADKGRTWGKPCRKCGVDKPRKYPHNWCKECEDTEKQRVNKLLTISPQERIEIERVGFGMGLPPTEGPEKEEGGLKYRQLRFPYEALPEGRLKKLVDKACEGGVDPGLVVPAILTLLSSIPHQDEMAGGMRINLYCTLLALVGAGKDVAIDRAIDVTGLRDYEDVFWTNYAPAGERSLSQHLGDRPPAKGETQRQPGPTRRCIVTYELEETLDKSKGETSSVLRAMQHYWDHDRKVYEDSKFRTTQTVDCRVSWLAGLPVGDGEIDEASFRLAFGERSSHGTGSRMIFGFAEKRVDLRSSYDWEPDKSLYEYGTERVEEIPDIGPVTIDDRKSLSGDLMSPGAMVRGWAPGVREQYLAWQPKKDLSGRDPHHCGKIAVLTALANGHQEITQEDWDFAVAFMTWQHEIRLVFTSGRAKTITLGEFKDTIMKEAEKRTKKLKQEQKNTKDAAIALVDGQEFLLIRWKAMSRDGKWFRFGWDAAKAIESLVSDGHLAYKQEYVEAEDGSSKGRWKADKAWVEWLG